MEIKQLGRTPIREFGPDRFYEPGLQHRIAVRELGWAGAFNDFVGHLGGMGDLKHGKGAEESIAELRSLIHGHRASNNSPAKTKISGSLAGRVTNTLISGKCRKSETDLKLAKLRKRCAISPIK